MREAIVSDRRLTGVSPFAGKNLEDVIARNRSGEVFFSKELWKALSPDAIDLVVRMTDRDQYRRPTAKECLEHRWFTSKTLGNTPLSHVMGSLQNIGTE